MTKPHVLWRLRYLISLGLLILASLDVSAARAQDTPATTPRTPAQVEQLVAPIALYPDPLLSQILMASTYPLEVVAAARWSQSNPGVTGDALKNAMGRQTWDPSVKALTALPQTLQMMSDKIDWIQQLGDAFLAQQGDVLDAVQRLRARADANGQLKSTPQQTVSSEPHPAAQQSSGGAAASAPAKVYTIVPTNPDEYYVPTYDPGAVYGEWPYPEYPPYSWYPPGYGYGYGLAFGTGILVGSAIWGNVDWGGNRVEINPLRYNNFNRTNISNGNWNFNPAHRGNVPYRDASVAQRFGNQAKAGAREQFRGQADAGRRELVNDHGNNNLGRNGANNDLGQNKAANAKGVQNKAANAKGVQNKGAQNKVANAKGAQNKGIQNKAANKAGAGNNVAQQGTTKNTAAGKSSSKTAANKNRASGNQQARANAGAARQASIAGPSRSAGARNMGGGRSANARAGGGGRRSDIRLKHDVTLLGHLDNGIGFYRFSYNGSNKAYVGVIAQEVETVVPEAVNRDGDGYLRVSYDRLGLTFQTYQHWIASGAHVPPGATVQR